MKKVNYSHTTLLQTWLIFQFQPVLKLGLLGVFYSHKPIIYIPTCHIYYSLGSKKNCSNRFTKLVQIELLNMAWKKGKLLHYNYCYTTMLLLLLLQTWLIFQFQPVLKLGLLGVFYSHKPIIYIPTCHIYYSLGREKIIVVTDSPS
jgi:hypothetical protein